MSKKPNIVQLTNDYIDNANQEQRLERAEHEQRNRFMGWILFCGCFTLYLANL